MKNIKKVLISIMLIFMLFPTTILAVSQAEWPSTVYTYQTGGKTYICDRETKKYVSYTTGRTDTDGTVWTVENRTRYDSYWNFQVRNDFGSWVTIHEVSRNDQGQIITGDKGFEAKEDTMSEFDKYVPSWLKNAVNKNDKTGETAKQTVIQVAVMAYDLFFIASLFFCGFKVIDAIWLSETRAQHAITKNQLNQEIFEPIKGLIYFVLGLIIIRLIIVMVMPEYAGLLSILNDNI